MLVPASLLTLQPHNQSFCGYYNCGQLVLHHILDSIKSYIYIDPGHSPSFMPVVTVKVHSWCDPTKFKMQPVSRILNLFPQSTSSLTYIQNTMIVCMRFHLEMIAAWLSEKQLLSYFKWVFAFRILTQTPFHLSISSLTESYNTTVACVGLHLVMIPLQQSKKLLHFANASRLFACRTST